MKSFQPKRGFRNIVYSRPVLVILGVLLIFFVWGVVGFMGKMTITTENKKIAENRVLDLQKEKVKLSSDIAKLKTDSGVEESIRDKFGLAKEGEGLIVVEDDKNSTVVPKKDSGGFFSFLFFWKNWFK